MRYVFNTATSLSQLPLSMKEVTTGSWCMATNWALRRVGLSSAVTSDQRNLPESWCFHGQGIFVSFLVSGRMPLSHNLKENKSFNLAHGFWGIQSKVSWLQVSHIMVEECG